MFTFKRRVAITLTTVLSAALALPPITAATAQQQTEQAAPLPSDTDMQAVTEVPGLVFADEAEFRAYVRAYLLEEPEVLVEAMQVLEQRRLVQEVESEREMVRRFGQSIFEDGFSYVGGNPNGSLTVVEFQDYRCGYCKRAHDDVQELVASDGDIRLIIKEFPILGPDSTLTSQLAVATMITQGPEAYKRLSDALMTYAGPVNDGALERLAKSANVDLEKSRAKLDDPEVARRIAQTHELGRNLAISGTPTFIVGEKLVRGYLPLEEMRRVVQLSRSTQ